MAANQPVTRRAFKPFGEARGPKPTSWPDSRSYLGAGIDDTATGLTHLGAREYDQANGRFISADPLLDITDPLQMNGYSYAKNSPVSTSDPDGLKPVTDCWRGCKDGDSVYRDWVVPGSDGGWSTRHETSVYSYDVEGDLHSVTRTGNYHPTLGTTTVIKPYNLTAQKNTLKFVASLVIPDVESWKKTLSGEANGWDYLGVATDLPFTKILKLVPDSVVKKGAKAVENWLEKAKGCKCFLAGTKVLMADGETQEIEKIEVGDEVVATDPETGETRLRKVTRLIVTEDGKHFNELTIETPDGPEKLTATHEHPFWVPEIGAWVEARNLVVGTTLRTPDGTTVRVVSNRAYAKHARTYNLTIEDLHTYYVLAGATPVLVHNSSCLTGAADSFPGVAHTLDEHVGISNARAISLAASKPGGRNSVFIDHQTAQQVSDYAVANNSARIQKWLRGSQQQLTFSGRFGANNSLGTTFHADGSQTAAGNGYFMQLTRAKGYPGDFISQRFIRSEECNGEIH